MTEIVTLIHDEGLPTRYAKPIRTRQPVSGSDVLGWAQVGAIAASGGAVLTSAPAAVFGTIRPESAVALCLLTFFASILAIGFGAVSNSTDRIFGMPLKGGCWWDYAPSRNKTIMSAVGQIVLFGAVIEVTALILATLVEAL